MNSEFRMMNYFIDFRPYNNSQIFTTGLTG